MNMQSVPQRSGPVAAIGGAEDKTSETEILMRILAMAPAGNTHVAIIPTASGIPEDVFDSYKQVFMRLGATEVHKLDIRSREDANDADHIATLNRCGVIFMTGGDQMRLTNILGGSDVLETIRQRQDAGAVIAGTSAGAACMSSTMIYAGSADDSLRKGAVRMSAGLSFIQGVIIDSHFLERGRFSRLMEVGATNPEYLGIGLGEDAGVILHDGQIVEVFGPGHVVIVDSSAITGSNVADVHEGEAVTVHNVVMHALIDGYGYNIRDRQIIQPADLEILKAEQTIADTRTQSA